MIQREAWYREAINDAELSSHAREFRESPSWDNFQRLLRTTERFGVEMPYEVFQTLGVDWSYLRSKMKLWLIENQVSVTESLLSSYWMMFDVDPFQRSWWPLNVPSWFIEKARSQDLPIVSVVSIYAVANANYEVEFHDLNAALEMGWYRPEDGGHEPIVTHELQGNRWVPNRPYPDVPDYPERGMDLKTLLITLKSGYVNFGGVWEKDREPPEDVLSRYPSAAPDLYEVVYIMLPPTEINWQVRDAEIESWVSE